MEVFAFVFQLNFQVKERKKLWLFVLSSSLRLVVVRCSSLWFVVVRCDSSWLIVVGCGSLWFVAARCGSLWLVVVRCMVQYNPLLTILEKNVFRAPTISLSKLIISPSSINGIFALNGVLSERNGLTVLQNVLLSVMLFLSNRL